MWTVALTKIDTLSGHSVQTLFLNLLRTLLFDYEFHLEVLAISYMLIAIYPTFGISCHRQFCDNQKFFQPYVRRKILAKRNKVAVEPCFVFKGKLRHHQNIDLFNKIAGNG